MSLDVLRKLRNEEAIAEDWYIDIYPKPTFYMHRGIVTARTAQTRLITINLDHSSLDFPDSDD
jgi:hypothetical protein